MSVTRLTRDDVESLTVITTPLRSFSSSSSGVLGSVKVFPRLSSVEKETSPPRRLFEDSDSDPSKDTNFEDLYSKIRKSAEISRIAKKSIYSSLSTYMDETNKLLSRPNQTLEISRFTPTTQETKYTRLKDMVKDVLMPHYAVAYTDPQWAYKNYHSLNFFTTEGNYTNSSVLIYPNVPDPKIDNPACADGSYILSGAFSFDFHINPRYQSDHLGTEHFKAGTLLHLSSSYAISLVTGSAKDHNGFPIGFRLMLQLSHSADYPPSQIQQGAKPHDLVFLSEDNSLSWNKWHHAIIRWGTNTVNNGTGSFIIDGIKRGDFIIPSSSVALPPIPDTPHMLCVGNFYEGTNYADDSQTFFFTPSIATREGVRKLTTLDIQDNPDVYQFTHPLNAEVHDVAIRRYYMSDKEIQFSGSVGLGVDAQNKRRVAFYLPPFFTQDSPLRKYTQGVAGTWGGIFQTPFYTVDGTTDDPFNVAMAFGVNAHYINLENFSKDFSTNRFPRLLYLTGTVIDYTTQARDANAFVYEDPQMVKRNLTVLPCDDGKFDPDYSILERENLKNKFVDYFGRTDYSMITLDNLMSAKTLFRDDENYRQYEEDLYGASPEKPGLAAGQATKNYNAEVSAKIAQDANFDRGIQTGVPLTIYQRLKDASSNQVTFFNISNLFYGTRILPGSFVLKDGNLTGSRGTMSITLKDDGSGGLYRADSFTSASILNTVGHVFYDEGIVVIKNPHLYNFGKDQFEVTFKGVKPVHTMKYEVLAAANTLNSSSNPTYSRNAMTMAASDDPNDNDTFVYIDTVYFHDENMNVVAKAKLAQPIMKREGDKILFKVALDF